MKTYIHRLVLLAIVLSELSCIPFVRAEDGYPDAKCKEFKGSIFKPCICAKDVPNSIKYRPSLKECGGKAAAILTGNLADSFSVVLRDNQNRDRWPATGYHGCSLVESTVLGLNKCSAFKAQKSFATNSSSAFTGEQTIHCFGERATSPIMKGATRLTIKIRDLPNSGNDPLLRVCLTNFDERSKLN